MSRAPLTWTFRRVADGSVHLFDIQFEKYGLPRFVVNFGECSTAGVKVLDKYVPAESIFAADTPVFGRLQPGRGASTRSWFRQDPSFVQRLIGKGDGNAPTEVVEKLMSLFPQIERFWQDGVIGTNIQVEPQEIVQDVSERHPHASTPAQRFAAADG